MHDCRRNHKILMFISAIMYIIHCLGLCEGLSGSVFLSGSNQFWKYRSDRIRISASDESYLSPACLIRAVATWKISERSLIFHILASRNISEKVTDEKICNNIISNKPPWKEFNKKTTVQKHIISMLKCRHSECMIFKINALL